VIDQVLASCWQVIVIDELLAGGNDRSAWQTVEMDELLTDGSDQSGAGRR
jgi:hypothetical protein